MGRRNFQMTRNRIALDCETFPIEKGAIFPKVVCVSLAGYMKGQMESFLYTDGQEDTPMIVRSLLEDQDIELIGLNIKYDLACIKNTWPELTYSIWQALADGRVTDCTIREKLLNLSSHGKLEAAVMPDGSSEKLIYSMEFLAAKYLGVDLSKVKKDEDSWRLRYNELTGMLPEEYPQEAFDYAIQDAELTLLIAAEQDLIEQSPMGGPASMNTQDFQTACDFALGMFTENGFHIDPEAVKEVEDMLNKELAPENMQLLIESGALRPAEEPRPYKNGAKDKDGNLKMTGGKKESINKKVFCELVKTVCEDNDIEVKYTDPTEKYPEGQIATDSATMDEIAELHPTLLEYQHRQKILKLRTSYIPNLQEGIVYAPYDVLKETGRTSSKKDKLYPSWNGQQVDPRVRGCCIARPGHVLVSSDYSSIELVSLAQGIYDMFGQSSLRDLIMDGVDPHGFLGAQLAFYLSGADAEIDFEGAVRAEIPEPNPRQIYSCFLECKTADDKVLNDFYAHYRKLAKPVGLGYPGGLGPQTCMEIAKDTYGVEGDLEMFTQLREIWHDTFPEMKSYFEKLNKEFKDPADPDSYCYMTPLGMYRAGCTYCAAANGLMLQSPTAEGAKGGAVFDVARACCDPAEESILYGCRPLLFIHDEDIVEIPEDELMHERSMEIKRLMEEGMGAIFPDMIVKAEPAIMRRWDKRAEPVFDENGRLIPWEPDDEVDIS
jgi:DNA polymerase I-like protein with 3'-5' exonuclease and polymerase domains